MSLMDKSHPIFAAWVDALKSTKEPRGWRCPIIYDTKLKDYVFSPLGILIRLFALRDTEAYSVQMIKEDGCARNGSYKECKITQNRDDRVYLVSLPWDIEQEMGIKNGIRIYFDRLSAENHKRFLNKVMDVCEHATRFPDEYDDGRMDALLNIRAAIAGYRSVSLSDISAIQAFSFQNIGVLLKMAGDSGYTREDMIDSMLQKKFESEQLKKKQEEEKQLSRIARERAELEEAEAWLR